MDKKTRILIVDDHPAMCQGIAMLVANEPDFSVCGEASDRQAAMNAIEREIPDLVILDISLKDGDFAGLDLIPDIHAMAGPIPILIYSMHDEMRFALKALQAGARGYLMKQAPARYILAAIRRLLETGVYVSDAVNRQVLMDQVGTALTEESSGFSRNAMTTLSRREQDVFTLVGKGLPPREIATELNISAKTVESHRRNIRKKLGISNASAMIRFAVDWIRQH